MDTKSRVKLAVEKFHRKQISQAKTSRKNSKPEKEVEKKVLDWCKKQSWNVSVVESKAVFSAKAGRFLRGQAQAGFADIVGMTDQGLFVALELKAANRLSTVRESQYEYLTKVIESHGFAAVVDSTERLQSIYQGFLHSHDRKNYLISQIHLPKALRPDNKPLFD